MPAQPLHDYLYLTKVDCINIHKKQPSCGIDGDGNEDQENGDANYSRYNQN